MKRHRGSIRKRGDAWLLTVYVGLDPNGKRTYRFQTVQGKRRDAERELTKMLGNKDSGTLPLGGRETLNAYLDRWLENKKTGVSRRTGADYDYLLKTHVRPVLGGMRLANLRPPAVQALYDGMRKRGLSGRTVHVTHNVLRQALAQAVAWQLIAVNPADATLLPRWEREEMQALTGEQVRKFLEAAESDPLVLYFHLAFATGMRPAELLGLRWQNVDLEAGQVHVREALERVGSEWRWKEPKAHSVRTVPLPSRLTEKLRAHKAAQAREIMEHLRKEHVYRNHGLVFAGRFGEPFEARNVSKRHLKPILDTAKLPKTFRLYDTRHTTATLLCAAGENPKVIADRLGHKDVALTLNIYSHVTSGMQERATATLSDSLYETSSR